MSTSAFEDLVRDARQRATPLRIAGRSHWMNAGRPVAAERIATLATHTGVVDYVPGDLTITVRSGVTLREVARITREQGQWFPLNPHGAGDGTIGATIVTGSSGPLSHRFGMIRDLVLGVEFVTGEGKTVRGGGRVVKNVAGFDLVRLITGSWGTLGIVTEATLRLYSLPAAVSTLAVSVPGPVTAIGARIDAVLSNAQAAFSAELLDAETARLCGLPMRPAVLVCVAGTTEAVASQRDDLVRLAGVEEVPSSAWERLRNLDGPDSAIVRVSCLPENLPAVWTKLHQALSASSGARMHASIALGLLRCAVPAAEAADALQRIAVATADCTLIYERLPAAMWPKLSASVVTDRLSQGIKSALDPSNILNPGILGPLA